MACGRSLVAVLVFLCHSWYPRAEAANGEAGECISGFGPVVTPFGYITHTQQVIIPSFQFSGSGNILAFHLSGICGGAEGEVQPNQGDSVSCINILQVWRPSGGDGFSIAANFTATLAVAYNTPVTTSVTVDTHVPFSSDDVLGFTPGPDNPGFYFQIANTPNQQSASHMYYTYDSFVTELSTTDGNKVISSPIISVEVKCSASATMKPPELPSSTELISPVKQTGSPSVSSPLVLPDASTSQPASESTSSSPEMVTIVATPTSVSSGGQEESGASAGIAAGVTVGLVLAVVVVVVVVVAIVLAAVCSVRRRRQKYDPTCSVTYEVPPDVYVAISNPEAVQYEIIPLSNGKGSPDGVYDVPCEVDKMEHTGGPRGYEVPRSSTLHSSCEAVAHASAVENGAWQGEIYYNMGCCDDETLCNPTATPTYGNKTEHKYQEADFTSRSTHPVLEESVEQETFAIYGFVPTVSERSQLPDDEDTEYQLLQECSTETAYYNNSGHLPQTGDTCNGNGGNVVDGVYETSSTDEGTYWSPSSKEEEIYAQMSRRKYQEIPRDKVKMLTKLGEGEFGEVYKAVLKTPTGTRQDVAVKVVKKGAPQEERLKLLQEAAILGQFRHNHILHLVGVVTTDEPRVMITELLSGGNLKNYLDAMEVNASASQPTDPALPVTLLKFCRQVAEGLSYLAGKSFVHRDIAARNILLDKELNCKLSGFGMTRDLSEEEYYTIQASRRLCIKWTAPEMLFYKKYSTSSDVWSYGMLMYEIWSLGHAPFGDSQPKQVVKLLKERYCHPPLLGCPRAVYAIMVDCWHPDPHCRPAASSLCSSINQPEADHLPRLYIVH